MRVALLPAFAFVSAGVAQMRPVLLDLAPCTYTVAPATQNVPAAGGNYVAQVTANCPFYAVASDPWIAVPGNGTYSGSALVSYSVAPSTAALPRTGQLTAGLTSVAITQAGVGCRIAFSPAADFIGAAGGSGRAAIAVNDQCTYFVADDSPWLSFVASEAGDTGTVLYTADPNPGPQPRVATLIAGGQPFKLTQFGTACAALLSVTTLRVPAAGASRSVGIASDPGCPVAVQNTAPWIAPANPLNGSVAIAVQPNTTGSPRSALVLIGGTGLTIDQPASGVFFDPSAILNAANLAGGPLAPGELIAITGSGLGPLTLAGAQLDPLTGGFATLAGGTRVLIDGVAAPLVYVSEAATAALVPWFTPPDTLASVAVEVNGVSSAVATVPVIPVAPALFTANAAGTGQAAALNADYSFNSADRPTSRGSFVILYANGLGPGVEPLPDGTIAVVAGANARVVLVTVDGIPAPVTYSGLAPGIVYGVSQLNVLIPANVVPGPAVPVTITVDGTVGAARTTIAIQ